MRHQSEGHSVVANVNIRVVASLFGESGDEVYEGHCANKIFEEKVADKLALVKMPGMVLGEEAVKFWLSERLHVRMLAG